MRIRNMGVARIRNLLLFTMGATLISALALASVLIVTNDKLNTVAKAKELTYQVNHDLGQLYLFTHDMLRTEGPRAQMQWISTYQELRRTVQALSALELVNEAQLDQIQSDINALGDTFYSIGEAGIVFSERPPEVLAARRQMLSSQLTMQLQSLVARVANLRDIVAAREAAERQKAIWAAASVLLILLLVVVGNTLLIIKRLAEPLARLHAGVREITAGNWEHRLGITSKDEFGDLAKEIDGMTHRLKEITASKLASEKESEERLAYLAHHDRLTGLPNRLLLEDRLEQAIASCKRSGKSLALLFLDLDRFKNVNDTMGHLVGDKLLQCVADRLNKCVRHMDTVSRRGGDEFVILIPEIDDVKGAADVSEKILSLISAAYQIEGKRLEVTTSVGISVYPIDGHTAEELTQCADIALYEAKAAGKNAYRFFTAEMSNRAARSALIERELRHGLNNGEFELHYQPQFRLADEKIVGMEALLRWTRSGHQFGPAEFIPIAEETGIIHELGRWALREACQQNKRLQDLGISAVPVAVNVSAAQVKRRDFVMDVKAALADTGLDPQYLELELTESMVMNNEEDVLTMLNAFKEMGVKLSIDDFGTGYSSLGYLKRFPIDTIKIDQSFVRDIPGDSDDAAITEAVIKLAQSLRLNVIAEGVETEKQLDFLRHQQCNEIQGWYFCRPLNQKALETYLSDSMAVGVA